MALMSCETNRNVVPPCAHFFNTLHAFLLKVHIADAEGFIHHKHFRAKTGEHTEGQSQGHPAAVGAQGAIEKIAQFGEGFDLRHLFFGVARGKSKELRTAYHVLAAGKLQIYSGTEFEEAEEASADDGGAGGGAEDAGEDFEEGAFSRAVGADEAVAFTAFYLEVNVAEGPEIGVAMDVAEGEPFGEACGGGGVHFKAFAEVVGFDEGVGWGGLMGGIHEG